MTRWLCSGLPLIALLAACSGAPRPATAPEPPPMQEPSGQAPVSGDAACGADTRASMSASASTPIAARHWQPIAAPSG